MNNQSNLHYIEAWTYLELVLTKLKSRFNDLRK